MTENENTVKNYNEDPDAELEGSESISEDEDVSPSDADKGASDNEGPVDDPIADLESRLEAAEQARQAEQDRYMRLYAEFDNYKKRTAREMSEFRKYATENLIKELIPVVDNLERAISSSGEDTRDKSCILEGVEMTRKEILRVLEKYEVKPIDALGTPFDPNFHEAVGQEESETEADNIVVRELLKGYTMHDRLIRPTMVIVSKAKPAENT
ncbi:MAG: nucleotide exchange factor GrpE [Thermodesulfobacteriota bacterium]